MNVLIDSQNTIDSTDIPNDELLQRWVLKVLTLLDATFLEPEITIRVVSLEESQQLNFEYRSKNKPTNVLSFPFEAPEMIPSSELGEFLGDLVICEQIVINEAKEQNKVLMDHWAHLVIHGVFHLLGFDHIEESEAEEMESLEIKVLEALGINNPY